MARIQSAPVVRVLQAGGLALLIAFASSLYQRITRAHDERSLAETRLRTSALDVQRALEALQMPCLLESDSACAERFERLSLSLNSSFYAWRDDASRRARDIDAPQGVVKGIGYFDDFFNPGASELASEVRPLQIALHSEPVLRTRAPIEQWCSPSVQARLDAVSRSINVFRYCFSATRRLLGGLVEWESMDATRRAACFEQPDYARWLEAVQTLAGDPDNADVGAPWLRRGVCS